MKKTKIEKKNSNDEMMIDLPSGVFGFLGILFIGFAVVDYAASRMGTNLTAFLGPMSQFTPIAAGLIGGIFLTIGDKVNKSSTTSPVKEQGILIKQRR